MFLNTKYVNTESGDRTPVTINVDDIHSAKPVRGLLGVDQWQGTQVHWRNHEKAPRIIDVDYTTFTTLIGAVNAS